MLDYTVTTKDHCRTAGSFLRNLLPTATTGYLHKLLKNGHLLRGGVPLAGEELLRLGDLLAMKESAKTASLAQKRLFGLDILYEDDQVLVVNKEPGLAVHKAAEDGDRNLVVVGERYLLQRGVVCKLRPVNRIDRGTSGGVMLAKSATAAGMFGRYIMTIGLGKVYLATVSGRLEGEGVIDLPLDGKESLTRYRSLFSSDQASIAAIYPVSGRLHQIRRHLSAINRPILGDYRYGGPVLETYPGNGLHAFALSLRHPGDDTELAIYAPLPAGLLRLLEQVAGPRAGALIASLPDLPRQLPVS